MALVLKKVPAKTGRARPCTAGPKDGNRCDIVESGGTYLQSVRSNGRRRSLIEDDYHLRGEMDLVTAFGLSMGRG